MSNRSLKERFVSYLLAAIPGEYPISGLPLSLQIMDARRKEIVFQQAKFLELAESLYNSAPWLSFLAARKHIMMLEAFDIDSAMLKEFSDKEYLSQVEFKATQLESQAGEKLDDSTRHYLMRLVDIQVHFEDICKCREVVNTALREGISAFDPTMEPLDESYGGIGCLFIIGASIIGGILAPLFLRPPADVSSGAFMFLSGLVILLSGWAIWWGVLSPRFKKEEEFKERFKRFQELEREFRLHGAAFDRSLSWNLLEAARDLSTAGQLLASIIDDRPVLESHYINPYLDLLS